MAWIIYVYFLQVRKNKHKGRSLDINYEEEILDIYDLMDFEEVVEPDETVKDSKFDENYYGTYDDDDFYPRQGYDDCYECY